MIISEEIVQQLSLWVLNYDEDFKPLQQEFLIGFTPKGEQVLKTYWDAFFDSEFTLKIQDIKDILFELTDRQDAPDLLKFEPSLELMSFPSILKEAVRGTFETYQNPYEFYAHVSLTDDDFETIVEKQLSQQSFGDLLNTSTIEFDELMNQLDHLIESKGYHFNEETSQWMLAA